MSLEHPNNGHEALEADEHIGWRDKPDEWNLSDKIQEEAIGHNRCDAIITDDVKEFIRRLKQNIQAIGDLTKDEKRIMEWIDKLAGDKLI